MKIAVLTLGPRGAGKTTFCKEVVRARPEIGFVERDAILLELYGGVFVDSGLELYTRRKIFERVSALLESNKTTVILDAWTMLAWDRREMVDTLRVLGFGRVVGWHFVTPEEDVVRQFLTREATSVSPWRFMAADAVLAECQRYRTHRVELEQGFDHLVEINPMQRRLFPAGDDLF